SGILEVTQPDRDGDIAHSRTNVALSPDAPPRPYAVYFVPAARNLSTGVSVRLLDSRGQSVPIIDERGTPRAELSSDAIQTIGQEAGLVLDLSEPPIPLLGFSRPTHPAILAALRTRIAGTCGRSTRAACPTAGSGWSWLM